MDLPWSRKEYMDFWKNKKVLITGSTGFIGSALFSKLSSMGANVVGISKSGKYSDNVDVLNFSDLNSCIKKNKISICYHLAAESIVEAGQINPFNTFKTNIEGALNVLESARINRLAKIIIASTSHVYGDSKPPHFEEDTPKRSRPYETSKTCADLIAQSYANTFSLPVLIPRFVNVYGPGDLNFNRLIPKTIKSVLNGKNPKMWGGVAKRDYLYVSDVITAYIMLGQVSIPSIGSDRIFNFGSNNVFSVKEIIEKIILLSGKNLKIKKIKNERDFEINTQYSSWEKANRILKWQPKYGIDKGLRETIGWYK